MAILLQARNMWGRLVGKAGSEGDMILVTGASGLVGRHLCAALDEAGRVVRRFDIKRSPQEDICDANATARAVTGVTGIIHLAAVSRVIDGERMPERCWRTNVGGLKTLLDAAIRASGMKPWIVFVSSREVYGNAAKSPTPEDLSFGALNTYAHSKVAGERLVCAAREAGVVANVCRLSTVYGATSDHADRVLPAFCRAAALGGKIHIDGDRVVVDPTHIHDVTKGLMLLAGRTAAGELLPPIHFVSGRGFSLVRLAELAIAAGGVSTEISIRAPRKFDVSHFVGDPERAETLLGWTARIRTEDGIRDFVRNFRTLHDADDYCAGVARLAGARTGAA